MIIAYPVAELKPGYWSVGQRVDDNGRVEWDLGTKLVCVQTWCCDPVPDTATDQFIVQHLVL